MAISQGKNGNIIVSLHGNFLDPGPGTPAQEKGRGRDFSKEHQRYDFDVIPMDGIKRRSLGGGVICNFGVHQRYEQWQPENFRQGWPRVHHATIQNMGVFQFWSRIVG